MARYVGGPYDGREIVTRYDHLPVIDLPWSESERGDAETIESYEMRRGVRVHCQSRPYPRPGQEPTP